MNFQVTTNIPMQGNNISFLVPSSWDDWFSFETMYSLWIFTNEGERKPIGDVKIGQYNMASNQRRPNIPVQFESLSDEFFSLGQDESYYQLLNMLGVELKEEILTSLNDIAFNDDKYQQSIKERVTKVSLLRSVSPTSIQGQFRRLAHGGARLSRYSVIYQGPSTRLTAPLELAFDVIPETHPPTNIHVLIGRNGVGKTYLLNNMISSLTDREPKPSKVGQFIAAEDNATSFANIVSVTFSAFDESEPPKEQRDKSLGIQYSYVGLKRTKEGNQRTTPPKSPVMLKNEFVKSIVFCRATSKLSRWEKAIKMLQTDPIFEESNIHSICEIESDEEFKERAEYIFKKLSSGHKIVLLTITRLVETVEEKSLVLLDEPEAHLHPPLLSAFIRSLSDLLIQRNGVAIIATHSPVVLQEVPKSCVWMLRRNGHIANVDRLEVESFGENVGILTSEVFGLEVTNSGFHKIISDAVSNNDTYDEAIASFNNQLGMEAKAIMRGLFYNKNNENNN